MLGEAEILYDFPRGRVEDLVRFAPRVRWVHSSIAGAGEVADKARLQETDVIVTTASGVYSGPLAEFGMMALLQHVKDLDRLRRDKAEKRWREAHTDTLSGKTMCIVGMGDIGRAVAERARPFGVRVVGVKRTVREADEAWDYAVELYPMHDLHQTLREAEYVVVTLPGTPETYHFLDAAAISTIKRGAYFVNVRRGKAVEEGALVEALRDGRLSGAALDVFDTLTEDTSPALGEVSSHWSGRRCVSLLWGVHHAQLAIYRYGLPGRLHDAGPKVVEMGVELVGGCCDIGPDHILMLKERFPKRSS